MIEGTRMRRLRRKEKITSYIDIYVFNKNNKYLLLLLLLREIIAMSFL